MRDAQDSYLGDGISRHKVREVRHDVGNHELNRPLRSAEELKLRFNTHLIRCIVHTRKAC